MSSFRECHPARMALKQGNTQFIFKQRNLTAYRTLRKKQSFGGMAYRTVRGNLAEVT